MSGAAMVNIVGEVVALGPLRRDLLPTYQRWINDFGTLRHLLVPPVPMTMEQEQGWFERAATGEGRTPFTIYERASWTPIGNASLADLDYRHRTAEFGILIGEPAARGKGYGTETARLLLDYAFTALGLHSVMLRVHEGNLAGRRAYTKAGYRECGRRRQCHWMGGRFWDTIYMECLASEFTSTVLSKVFVPDVARG
jgi:diamine N-acetyltransferase